jgi:hypothetical protein
MAAVEFAVEALGIGIGDGAWFWESCRSRFPRGLPPASRLESACLRHGGAVRRSAELSQRLAMARDFWDRIAPGSRRSASRLKTAWNAPLSVNR